MPVCMCVYLHACMCDAMVVTNVDALTNGRKTGCLYRPMLITGATKSLISKILHILHLEIIEHYDLQSIKFSVITLVTNTTL